MLDARPRKKDRGTSPTAAGPGLLRWRWIVSPRYDLVFFIGSCLVTFAFWALYRGMAAAGRPRGEQVLITYLVFTALFDHPHILQTFARTHADLVEFRRHRWLHTWGLAAFLAAGVAVILFNWEAELIVFTALYGTWHIVRQHEGFLRMYKSINKDRRRIDNLLDFGTFYAGALACLFTDYGYGLGRSGNVWVYGNQHVRFPGLPTWASAPLWYTFLALAGLLLVRQGYLLAKGRRINLPKLLLLTAVLGTHYFVFAVAAAPFLVAEALETAYHNVQYQGWMMYYQRRRFDARRVALKWGLVALVYGLLVGGIEVAGFVRPALKWLFVPFAILVLWHYFIDGVIWRTSQAPELRELLRPVAPAQASAGQRSITESTTRRESA